MYEVNKERLSEKEKASLEISIEAKEERIKKGEQNYMHKEKYAYMEADKFGFYSKELVKKNSKDYLDTDLYVWSFLLDDMKKSNITIYDAHELAKKYYKKCKNPIINYFANNYENRAKNFHNLVDFMSCMKLNYIDKKMLSEYRSQAEYLLNKNPQLLDYYISRYYRREDKESLVDSYKAAKVKYPETIDEL